MMMLFIYVTTSIISSKVIYKIVTLHFLSVMSKWVFKHRTATPTHNCCMICYRKVTFVTLQKMKQSAGILQRIPPVLSRMPSTTSQKAKARKYTGMDLFSDNSNVDVKLGDGNTNSIEKNLIRL